MKIQIIEDKKTWDSFFDEQGSPSFLESWEWGEFQKKMGEDILQLGIYKNDQLVAICLVIKVKAKRGTFLFIPHGPIIQVQNPQFKVQNLLETLITHLIQIANSENYSFIRIAPILEDTPENQRVFKDLGFRKAPIYMHAERMWVLPLNKTEDEILKSMRKTTRYLIKKASRDGVIIEKMTDSKAVDDFYRIYEDTAKRENFTPFSKKFIEEEFNSFNKTGHALFLFAKLVTTDGITEYLASALIIFTESEAFYHQGASTHSKIPATYLLQWEAIKEAKKRGCHLYNFWGILQKGRTPKNWAGLSLFKTGFGGHEIDYLPTQDFIISPNYYLTYLYEKFLAWKRGV